MAVKKRNRILLWIGAAALVLIALGFHYLLSPWGFYWKVDENEAAVRRKVVNTAQQYLGLKESDGSFRILVDQYNSQSPLPMGYTLTYEDSWCAAFVSVTALQAEVTELIPTECSCERQISLFQEMGRWEERDSITPLPGDIIYYDWDNRRLGDCTGWADHVGIVVGTKWPFLKVIEGNRNDQVCYRYLLINDISIRGFGKPDYASMVR